MRFCSIIQSISQKIVIDPLINENYIVNSNIKVLTDDGIYKIINLYIFLALVRNHIIKEFNSLIHDVQSDKSTAVFHINNSPILLRSYEEGDGCTPECNTCGDILDCITTDSDEPEYMKKKRKKGQPSKVLSRFHTTCIYLVMKRTVLCLQACCNFTTSKFTYEKVEEIQ